jgi:predicted RNA-binding Zn-ribbon protein involved in translation (DUF1610 family)
MACPTKRSALSRAFPVANDSGLASGQSQINYPDLLILDEPAASLDPIGGSAEQVVGKNGRAAMRKGSMMPNCPRCGSSQIIKNGTIHHGKPMYACKACRRQFVENAV